MYCTTQCTYIHYPLFDPKQISLFCIWAMTSFYRRVCGTEYQPQSQPPRLLKPSHVMVLKKKPLPISLSFALSNLAVVVVVPVSVCGGKVLGGYNNVDRN